MLEKNCCSFAAMLFATPVPSVTLTILNEMLYMSTIVKHRRSFEKLIFGNIKLKQSTLSFTPSVNIIGFVV